MSSNNNVREFEELQVVLDSVEQGLVEAIVNLEYYVRETGDKNAEVYFLNVLQGFIEGSGFSNQTVTINKLQSRLIERFSDPDDPE